MDPSATHGDLLYATDGVAKVYVYTYPQGRHVGTLTGLIDPLGSCVDASGDVFIVSNPRATKTAYPGLVTEYVHGGTKPLQTLEDPALASGCAIDPSTGNLAVSGSWYHGWYDGELTIYMLKSESKQYQFGSSFFTPDFDAFQMCTYDAHGNLYLSSGEPGSSNVQLVVAPKGSSDSLETISLTEPLYSYGAPVSVQWDGKNVTVSSTPDHAPVKLYRLQISGKSAKIVGTTTLSSKRNVLKTSQVWIQGKSVVDVDYFKGRAGVDRWAFPDAIKPQSVVPNSIHARLNGLTVSAAP
jgi:hypothetical protein